MHQIVMTGPFEVPSRILHSNYRLYGRTSEPVSDIKGLRLVLDSVLYEAPARRSTANITACREQTARHIAPRLGIAVP
jgi:hypothetical protein